MKTSIDNNSFLSLEESASPTGKGGAAGVVLNHGKEKPSNKVASLQFCKQRDPSVGVGPRILGWFQSQALDVCCCPLCAAVGSLLKVGGCEGYFFVFLFHLSSAG